MKLCVVGTGYVGLVSGTCLASVGHEVACVDVDAAKVERINRGEPPIHEERRYTSASDHFAGRRDGWR